MGVTALQCIQKSNHLVNYEKHILSKISEPTTFPPLESDDENAWISTFLKALKQCYGFNWKSTGACKANKIPVLSCG